MIATNSSPRLIAQRRFWFALILQLVLIITIPSQAIYIHLVGKTVVLQTVPIDPYDLLRGYSQTLRYDISQPDGLSKLPGGKLLINSPESYFSPKQQIYVILQAPASPNQPWSAIALREDRPSNLPPNQLAIRGTQNFNNGWIDYGLESFYFPETQRQEMLSAIQSATANNRRSFWVEAKIDPQGHATLVSLWIGGRRYQF